METQVIKWGNSQGIRLPRHVLQECMLQVNDRVRLYTEGGRIIIEKVSHKSLEERAKEYGGTLGPYEEFDWGEPEGREVW